MRACSVGEFLKGWRRKAGCVTLAMALLLAAAWMRSYQYYDLLWLDTTFARGMVYSSTGGVSVWWHQERRFSVPYGLQSIKVYKDEHGSQAEYWQIVLPLTLLSAWLLLTKPRPAKSAKESN